VILQKYLRKKVETFSPPEKLTWFALGNAYLPFIKSQFYTKPIFSLPNGKGKKSKPTPDTTYHY
jgi:hypothetical protein